MVPSRNSPIDKAKELHIRVLNLAEQLQRDGNVTRAAQLRNIIADCDDDFRNIEAPGKAQKIIDKLSPFLSA